ncbi:IclR family transcriptional regulator [Haloarchaeobius amylolyticus]|uniref:IclR family transcriptional regulator n=1 Tax=Haloarchaeobius amylolyticus TaxID=1198296 RepID=A0ABD6BCU1_9EURY
MISNSSPRQVQSVQTAFEIIHLIQEFGGITLNEVADHLDIAKSTVHNYLGTLESLGYVVKRDRTYRLGLRFLTHGMAARNSLFVADIVQQSLSTVAKETGQSTWWIVEEFGRGFFVDKAIPNEDSNTYGSIGKRSYLHTHAPGKAILAKLPRDYVRTVIDYHGLPIYTTKTTTDAATLMQELDTIRDQGYAVSDGETALGVQSAGVAFEDPYGGTNAIGVFGYTHDFGGENLEKDIPSLLKHAVSDITKSLERGVK